jgi:hypothetical protein
MFSFGLEKINELSKSICEEFAAAFPSQLQVEMKAKNDSRANKKLVSALDAIDRKIAAFLAAKPRIGVFRKAKCANDVKWGLKERGYEMEVVDAAVRKVVFGLSQKKTK